MELKKCHNEYKELIDTDSVKQIQNIDCIGILEYLDNYAGKMYCAKDKRNDENRKQIEKNEAAAKKAVAEFNKIANIICKEERELEQDGNNDWLDGSRQKLRGYLWIELKNFNKKEKPESISLFVESFGKVKKSKFRVSLEINNEKAKKISGEMQKYHKHLELKINHKNELVYISGSSEDSNIEIINEAKKDIIENVKIGKYRKVQISKVIERREGLTNEDYVKAILQGVQSLLPYYEYVVGNLKYEEALKQVNNTLNLNEFDKNMILYGPPGTGKTYNTAKYAVSICDRIDLNELSDYKKVMERYKQLKDDGRIEFTTFHQSYGYEEFIEGIKPVMDDEYIDDRGIKYKIEPGLFKKFCENVEMKNITEKIDKKLNLSPNVWKVSLKQTGDNDVRKECMDKEHIRIGWDSYGKDITEETNYEHGGKAVLEAFISKMQIGDIVLSCYSAHTIDAVGIIIGDYEWNDRYPEYKRLRKVEWLVKGINYNILDINNNVPMTLSAVYNLSRISPAEALKIVENTNGKISNDENKNYVFIIDEINRGNISKIFGELITLIETKKRIGAEEELKVKLPYSKSEFGVPDNIYILGTMNTADRNITIMDTALRRRFEFIEIMPEPEKLRNIKIEDTELDIEKMLDTINQRIEALYDREHTIGHALFWGLKYEPTLEKLVSIFEKSVIPLLQEYFYDDYSKIRLILGEAFIKKEEMEIEKIFKMEIEEIDIPEYKYAISKDALKSIESYINIYK